MPQGKVIAIKPSYTGGGGALRSFSSSQGAGSGSSNASGGNSRGRIIYIGVCKEESVLKCKRKNVESVVWFLDEEKEFNVGDFVTFDIDETNSKSINAAKNIEKSKIGGPGGILSKVALLASLLLLIAIMNDTRR